MVTMTNEEPEQLVGESEQVFDRVFDAPRDVVWKAWTEPERLNRWWGPKGFIMLVTRLDLRPGGVFHYCMRAPGGQAMWGKFVYREISAPERLVFVSSFSDESGSLVRNPMSANWPLEVMNTLTLAEQAGKTHLTLRGGPYSATQVERKTFFDARENIQQGFAGTFAQLDAYLAGLKA
jgi:uncharacterized protein YndB with AHSA1/START domain